MLYIFSLVNTISLNSETLSAGENPNGFQFGLASRFLGLESDFSGSLEPVLDFEGRTWRAAETTTSFTGVSTETDFTNFLDGDYDALIGGEEELLELAQLLGADREATLAANPRFADMLIYEVNVASSTLQLIDLPTDTGSQTGTAGNDLINGGIGDDVLSGLAGNDTINGGSGNDVIFGGSGADEISGDGGDDVLIAGDTIDSLGSNDIARFAGTAAEYQVVGGTDYAVVTAENGSRDKLFGFQFLQFDDGLVALQGGSALDGAGSPSDFVIAERVALLYEAALNRNGEIDLPGLNFYIDVTERDNLTDEFLAADLMTSQEFTDNFGDVNTLSNAEFLEQIYLNVLDRESDAAGRQFYLDLLDAGTISKALALADIAVSPENTVESVGVLRELYEQTEGDWAFL